MAFIIKWNLFIGIVAFMAYVIQKIMGKRLGHYWRKVVWILLTIKMCFPFWSVTEKFRQHFFIISMPAYYMGEQNQKTAIMTKIGNVSIREWMSGENSMISDTSQFRILHKASKVFVETDSSAISLWIVLLSKLLNPHLFLR